MTVVLPYPPSANRYWRNWRGRMVVSKEARDFKAQVKALAAGTKPLEGDVCVYLDIFRPQKSGDLDNFIKVTLDALKGIAFEDDRQVVYIEASRWDDKKNPRVVATVTKGSEA
jgi:crossover junction endodeoxyribonuclease RusA